MKLNLNPVLALGGLIFAVFLTCALCGNKYTEEMNKLELQSTQKPFRMQKLNIVWDKARKRLSAEKLKLLHTELKIQDKEEITWKRIKTEGLDKDGLKEAELRKKLRGILNVYDLTEHFEEVKKMENAADKMYNEAIEKDMEQLLFKDKKLNKLWMKAERAGFSEEEMKTLKEEFQHHQDKIDDYHQYIGENSQNDGMDNSVDKINKDYVDTKQLLKEKHRDLKSNYDRIGKMASSGPEKEFEEAKVKELWELAQKGNFSEDELNSLKEELRHFEHRVKKLQHLESQVDLAESANKWTENNVEDKKRMEQKIKHYSHKVGKIHSDIEGRIMQRHLEL